MLLTIELTPAEKREVELALIDAKTSLRQQAHRVDDRRLASLLLARASSVELALLAIRDAEPA